MINSLITPTTHKRVDELQPGDKLIAIDGEIVSVTKITRGFGDKIKIGEWSRGFRKDARIVEYGRNSWTCLRYDDMVEVAQ